MRDILFRGKRIDNGEWVYGDLIHRKIYSSDVVVIRTQDSGFDNYDDYDIIPETVGQYTGLKDNNGTKIFEGDIIGYESYKLKNTGVVVYRNEYQQYRSHNPAGFVVQWCNTKMALREDIPFWCGEYSDAEAVGNIHDNLELLEELR